MYQTMLGILDESVCCNHVCGCWRSGSLQLHAVQHWAAPRCMLIIHLECTTSTRLLPEHLQVRLKI